MAKYRSKLKRHKGAPRRRGRHGEGPDRREHFNHDGRPKKRIGREAAHKLAAATGMNAYRCAVCKGWHVGRPSARIAEEAGSLRRTERGLLAGRGNGPVRR